jgi:transmembrane sensor
LGFITKRDVYLQDGEAFFEVKKDKSHPFRVISQMTTTQVYGTSFNVKAYKKLNYNTVSVRTGKVRVQSKKAWYPDTLRADQSLTYSPQNGFIRLVTTQQFEANSWTEGTINLKDASFEELSLIFYNKYQERLTSKVEATHSQRYSIVLFHDQPIDSALKLICSIHNNHYRRNNHVVTITP